MEDVLLTYEYLGFEAGWTNAFYVDGTRVFQNRATSGYSATAAGAEAYSSASAGDLLDFFFRILVGGNAGYGVANGSNVMPFGVDVAPGNPNNNGAPNFFLGYVSNSNMDAVYIALDDGGGTPYRYNTLADDNHDDLVIKVTARPIRQVPEPTSLILLGSSLLGLAALRQKLSA